MGSKSSRHNEDNNEEGLDNEDENTKGSGTGDCDNIQSAQSHCAGDAEENIKGGWLIIDFKMLWT